MTNATLSAVTAGGTAPDYDSDGTLGAARWTGLDEVYVTGHGRDDRALEYEQQEGGGDVTEVVWIRVELNYWPVGQLVQRGDTLAYTFEGIAQSRIVESIIRTAATGRVRAWVRHG